MLVINVVARCWFLLKLYPAFCMRQSLDTVQLSSLDVKSKSCYDCITPLWNLDALRPRKQIPIVSYKSPADRPSAVMAA